MMITLPFDTPTTNVLRFILLEYIILKLFSSLVESLTYLQARNRHCDFQERWPSFFLVPYRIRHSNLTKLLPVFLVLFINSLLLAIEFGFQSTDIRHTPVEEGLHEVSTEQLRDSRALDGVDDDKWLLRMNRITEKCVEPNGFEFYAAEGFIRDATLDGPLEDLHKNEVLCADDSRIKDSPLSKVMFNISYTGYQDTDQVFQFADLELTVDQVTDNTFQFRGGDSDMRVSGKLDLSKDSRGDGDYEFEVRGSCTAFRDFDPRLYCYLTDGGNNRFIIPAVLADDASAPAIPEVSNGDTIRLIDSGPVFRASIQLWDESWNARDGDHLAAIKSLVLTFSPRRASSYDDVAVAREYLPLIVRTFYVATVLGATSTRSVTMSIETNFQESTERAQVTLWAFIMLCGVLILMIPAVITLRVYERGRKGKLNVPVSYNALVRMVKQTLLPEEMVRGPLSCGVIEEFGNRRYGPVGLDVSKQAEFDDV